MIPPIPEFGIIADDLTGSLDTGLQFRKKGLLTIVPLKIGRKPPPAQALVLNTDSRNLPGKLAYRRVSKVCRNLQAKAIYKKIDSTMRGNVGQEILAILDARNIPKAIIVPTVPSQGRTVERGILRVHGIPLLRTSYSRDPFHPIWTSRIADLLRKETGVPTGHLTLGEIRKGPVHLAEKIEKNHAHLLVADAVLQSDLQSIASAWKLLSGRLLACGSVGLAVELGSPVSRVKKNKSPIARRPLLIIAASQNPRTAEQLEEACHRFDLPMLEPDLLRLTNPKSTALEVAALSESIVRISLKSPGVLLATTFQEHLPGKEQWIPRALGKVVIRVLERTRLGGLILTGGDLAMGVCMQLSSSALRIEEEVLPGIPCSTLTDGRFKGLHLVTKAGGFGEKDALWRMIQYLRGKNGSQKT